MTTSIKEHISRGQSVEEWRVKDAPHCAIMKKFPELYKQKIETFFDKIN